MNAGERLAVQARAALAQTQGIREVRMFGGIGFMLNGNLLAGASERGLLVRVGEDRQRQAVSQPGVRPMVMRGTTMKDYVYIDPPGLDDRATKVWLKLAIAFVKTLPPKRPRTRTKAAKAKSRR
jgi:TfoX/Sxy family transcriptional regulator of competence genes